MAHLALLPRPDVPALGNASLDKLVVRLCKGDSGEALRESLARLQAAPVVQAVLAFVTAATGLELQGGWQEREEQVVAESAAGSSEAVLDAEGRWAALQRNYSVIPTGVLDQLAWLVGSSTRWPMAEELLEASGVGAVRRFRASCVTRSRNDTGFDCVDLMKVVGGGALSAHSFGQDPRWKVDLKKYDVEVYGFLFHDSFVCGLLLGGQWRRNTNEDKYSCSSVPFAERASRPYTVGDHQPWFMPRLRPSTSMLLLLLAGLQPNETMLDQFGGCGTIAIEAAVHFEGVRAITSDNHQLVTCSAIKNCVLARPHLAVGSTVSAKDWDARNLVKVEDASVDRVVTDLPFGNKCRWDVAVGLPAALSEVARVLRPGGRAVFLMKGYRRLEALLFEADGTSQENADCVEEVEDAEDDAEGVDPSGPEAGAEAEPCTTNSFDAGTMEAMTAGGAEVLEGSASNQTVCIQGKFDLVERRPVAIGGYLCYAIVLLRKT
ncbi:unnamed protein product [Polarella glacialis]|uniref:Ribosomal RNA large subunit methyltransferase K/L-like methyltransferase domain-containing protein n=1 Tax=Polarella glacialis TaxID=89957 RepID=A0A813G515_POLGL|nr:unnamed protein product [Polarella glacialis]CAE8659286.1 unnamed protein product [Polarella glacialis]